MYTNDFGEKFFVNCSVFTFVVSGISTLLNNVFNT